MATAIRRALNTPSKPNSGMVGESERVNQTEKSRAKKLRYD